MAIKMVKFMIEGILPAIITPFDEEGNVEFKYLKDVVNFQMRKGVHGFFVCGSAGEGALMSTEQRKTVAEAVLNEVKGRVPIIVHVGSTNTNEAVELAKHANTIGAAAVGAITPFYFKPDLEGLIEHYRSIAKAISIPVFIYNIPRLSGFNVTPDIARKICSIENVIGIKDSSESLVQIQEIIETVPKHIIVINGTDTLLFEALMAGVRGQISNVANVIPELMVDIYDSYKKGEYNKALHLQFKVNAVKRILEGLPISPVKAALELRGVKAGFPKRPLRPLSAEEVETLKERLISLNLFW